MIINHEFTVDIQTPIIAGPLGYDIVKGDGGAHRIRVILKDSGNDADLTGAAATLKIVRADGVTVEIAMDIDGNVITQAIPQEATAMTNRIYILVTIIMTGITQTVLCKYASIINGPTDVVVAPGEAIPNLETILELVSEIQDSVLAEELRVTAETNRQSAESARETAETGRVDTESSRVSAENERASAEIVRNQSIQRLLVSHVVESGDDTAVIEWSQADDETPFALKNAEVRMFVPENSLPVGTGVTISLRVNDITEGYHGTVSDAYTSAYILSTLRTLYGIVSCDLKVIGTALLINAYFLASDGTSRPTSFRPSAILSGITNIAKINISIPTINFPEGTVIEIYGREN